MRERKPLKRDTELRFTNHTGGCQHFVVGDVIGIGGSCIVYDGYYLNNAGKKSTIRIKECYPCKLHITRSETGELEVPDFEIRKFDFYKDRLRQSFEVANELHEAAGLVNSTANVRDIYEWNHTIYIVSSYVEGQTLAETEFSSLKEAVSSVLSTAKSIEQIHEKGYLYLDIKPDNIFTYSERHEFVQLFDFDTLIPMTVKESEDITEYRVSYTVGFSPVEQRTGDLSLIGKYTDVYSLGVLLFYLLFGRIPKAAECGSDAKYDYTKFRWADYYQKRLYDELTDFFNHTIQPYYKDRYQSMSEAAAHLTLIEKYADTQKLFLHSSQIGSQEYVLGRENECTRLLNWYDGTEKLIFVTGMGGIGKSSVVRKFIKDNWKKFDHLIYLQFKDSLCKTIVDDMQFCINSCEKDPAESLKEYFERKLKIARELVAGTQTLVVIDNFDGAINEEFSQLLTCEWKILVVTRSDMSNFGYPVEKIGELKDRENYFLLFENNMNRMLESREYQKIDHIVNLVKGHTLILALIAKQISRSYLDIVEAEKLVEICGFSQMAPEKVEYMQDGVRYYDGIISIIKSLYDVAGLSDEKRKCLKILSLFDGSGFDTRMAKDILQQHSYDAINELKDAGWIEVNERQVQMHPVIREMFRCVEWTEEYRTIALRVMQILIREIKENGKTGELYVRNYKKLSQLLSMTKSVLRYCGEDVGLRRQMVYKKLMQIVLINLSREEEDYIIHNAEILLADPTYDNPYFKIELYDYVVYLLCQQKNFPKAEKFLKAAKRFASGQKDTYMLGKYYEMVGNFYDAVLDGAYYSCEEKDLKIIDKMHLATDASIRYMSKSRYKKAKHFTIKYMLGKVGILIRSNKKHTREIKKLMRSTRKMMKEDDSKDTEIYDMYHLICAWYYTLCEEQKTRVLYHLEKLEYINKKREQSDLDVIDYFYIPAANMMIEMKDFKSSMAWLEKASDQCDLHPGSKPYLRKKQELLRYEEDVREHELWWSLN